MSKEESRRPSSSGAGAATDVTADVKEDVKGKRAFAGSSEIETTRSLVLADLDEIQEIMEAIESRDDLFFRESDALTGLTQQRAELQDTCAAQAKKLQELASDDPVSREDPEHSATFNAKVEAFKSEVDELRSNMNQFQINFVAGLQKMAGIGHEAAHIVATFTKDWKPVAEQNGGGGDEASVSASGSATVVDSERHVDALNRIDALARSLGLEAAIPDRPGLFSNIAGMVGSLFATDNPQVQGADQATAAGKNAQSRGGCKLRPCHDASVDTQKDKAKKTESQVESSPSDDGASSKKKETGKQKAPSPQEFGSTQPLATTRPSPVLASELKSVSGTPVSEPVSEPEPEPEPEPTAVNTGAAV